MTRAATNKPLEQNVMLVAVKVHHDNKPVLHVFIRNKNGTPGQFLGVVDIDKDLLGMNQ